jgi:hypothetical protein
MLERGALNAAKGRRLGTRDYEGRSFVASCFLRAAVAVPSCGLSDNKCHRKYWGISKSRPFCYGSKYAEKPGSTIIKVFHDVLLQVLECHLRSLNL